MSEWRIKIRVWPFSGGSEEQVGPEYQNFNIPAVDDFKTACRYADAFQMGIKCNPKVWLADVVSVEMVK